MVDLIQMRYFYDVAQTEHMTKSAKRLHIAQPALSQTIRKMENELGCELFERKGRGIKLSPSGKFMKDKVEKILADVDSISTDLESFQDTHSHLVTIDVEAALSTGIGAIVDYKEHYPEAEFQLAGNLSQQCCDIAITTSIPQENVSSPCRISENAIEFDEDICLEIPLGGNRKQSVTPQEIAKMNMVALSSFHSFRRICDKLCDTFGIRTNICFESECTDLIGTIVELGFGVTFVPAFSWIRMNPDLVYIAPIDCPGFKRCVRIELVDRTCATDESVRFFDFFKERVASFYAREENLVRPWEQTPWASDKAAQARDLQKIVTVGGF